MADIDVQQKKGPGVWPWILGLALLALVIWGVMEMGDDEIADDQALYDDTTVVAPAAETWNQDTSAAVLPADTGMPATTTPQY